MSETKATVTKELDLDFQGIIGTLEKEYAETEVQNRWMPPDGEYMVMLTSLNTGVSAKGNKGKMAWWRLGGRILKEGDQELDGKDFSVGFYNTLALWNLKGDVAVLAGRKIDDIKAVHPVLCEAVNGRWLIAVEVSRGVSDKGRKFTNTKILEVVNKEVEEVTADDTTSA